MRTVCIGIDVGSRVTEIAAVAKDSGEVIGRESFPTSAELLRASIDRIEGRKEVHVEACELAAWVCEMLRGRVARVVVSHPKSNAWIARDPLKSDRLDAFKLAELLRLGRVHEVVMTSDREIQELKDAVHHFDRMSTAQSRLKNQILSDFRRQGVLNIDSAFALQAREALLAQVPGGVSARLESLYALLDVTLKAKRTAQRTLYRMAGRFEVMKRFMQVPGIGIVGACRFFAYVHTPLRFATDKRLWRYARLGITDRQSDGKPLGYQKLDRNGNPRLKDVTRKAFVAAMKSDNMFRRMYQASLERTHHKEHSRLSVQRKFLSVLWSMWRNQTAYNDTMMG